MTIVGRLWMSALLSVAALVGIVLMEFFASAAADRSDVAQLSAWAAERTALRIVEDLKDAETGQRGYLLSGRPNYLAPFTLAHRHFEDDFTALHQLGNDDVAIAPVAARLSAAARLKIAELDETVALEQRGDRRAALAIVLSDRGRVYMESARSSLASILALENIHLDREQSNDGRLRYQLFALQAGGTAFLTVFIVFLAWWTSRTLRRATTRLNRQIEEIRAGDVPKIDALGKDELSEIGREFAVLAAELRDERHKRNDVESEIRLKNSELALKGLALSERTTMIDALRRLSYRLSGCVTEGELSEVVERLMPAIVNDAPGALYLFNNSRRFLEIVASWGEPASSRSEVLPSACWALRRGQLHRVADAAGDMVCTHVDTGIAHAYSCAPLSAQGETMGLLYVQSADVPEPELLMTLAETIAITLANVRLRRSLEQQSLRDPLTGLFNRRYLQEAGEIEAARVERESRQLAVLMIDVDHFKEFNDRFGHDAGDLVLRNVAEALQSCTRSGDVVARFGGEEFVVLLNNVVLSDAVTRAEAIRSTVKGLSLNFGGQNLSSVTISIGVALFPEHGSTFGAVVAAADAAMYRAKRAGRDGVQGYALLHDIPVA
jgi:diguanylate cyclase (GGDEF)-like protein